MPDAVLFGRGQFLERDSAQRCQLLTAPSTLEMACLALEGHVGRLHSSITVMQKGICFLVTLLSNKIKLS